jgi:hypothetical protein
MRPLQVNIWGIAALRTVGIPGGILIATLIATPIVIPIATRTATATLVAEVIPRTIVTRTATLTEGTAATGEKGVARLQQEAVGVGIVLPQAPGVDAATVGARPAEVAAARRNQGLARLTTVVMALLRLRRTPMEGGEPLKRQKMYGRAWCFLQPTQCADVLKVTGKKKKTWSLSILLQFHKISQVSMMPKFKAVFSTRNVLSALSNNSVARSVIFVRKNKLSSIAILVLRHE